MAKRINVKRKKLYRSMRENGVSRKKADRVLADVKGSRGGTGTTRIRRPKPVAALKGKVKKLRPHR